MVRAFPKLPQSTQAQKVTHSFAGLLIETKVTTGAKTKEEPETKLWSGAETGLMTQVEDSGSTQGWAYGWNNMLECEARQARNPRHKNILFGCTHPALSK